MDSSRDVEDLTILGQSYWVLDSSSTLHVFHYKRLFITYCPIRGDTFQMGNKQTCKVARIRDAIIKMYNECERVFTNFRHVPRFRRNLISFSTLDWCGCRYKALDGVL